MAIDSETIDSVAIDSEPIDSLAIDTGDGGGGEVLPEFTHFNPSLTVGTVTLSEENTRMSATGSGNRAFGDVVHNAGAGKRYIEFLVNTSGPGTYGVNDINSSSISGNDFVKMDNGGSNATFDINGVSSSFIIIGVPTNGVIGMTIDFNSAPTVSVELFLNGVSQGTLTASTTFSDDLRPYVEGTGADFPINVTLRTRPSEMQFLPVDSTAWINA